LPPAFSTTSVVVDCKAAPKAVSTVMKNHVFAPAAVSALAMLVAMA